MVLAPTLHQETRISPSASNVLHISASSSSSSSLSPFSASGTRKRPFDQISAGIDDTTYARQCLAVEGAVFHRGQDRAPRSFLWRVLGERKVLELQCVDIVRAGKTKASTGQIVFRIEFDADIVSNGVALADPEATDALEAFVVTVDGQLHTLTLKRDLLSRETVPSGEAFDASTVVKRFSSSALSFRHAYRVVAVSSLELLISLHDGGFIRLQREKGNTGNRWEEHNFSEGGWSGTLRGLISLKRQKTVRFGELELETNAVVALAKSPDGKFIWTVTLDHRLLAWSTNANAKGGPVYQMDLLNDDNDDGRKHKYVMAAEQGTVMQITALPTPTRDRPVSEMDVEDQHRRYYIVVRSPKDHQFKFYEVSSHWNNIEGDRPEVRDLQPRATLIPPIEELTNATLWHSAEFGVLPSATWEDCRLWIRVRAGKQCHIFTLTFSLLDVDGRAADVSDAWKKGWTTVDEGMQTEEALKHVEGCPAELDTMANSAVTPTERWLRFVLFPDRFSTVSVEAALSRYRRGRGLPKASSGKGLKADQAPLQERLAQAVSAKIMLKRSAEGEQPDYEAYHADVHAQWKTFYGVLSDLHHLRNEPISLSVDFEHGLPWTVAADFVGPIRQSSAFERLLLNQLFVRDDRIETLEPSDSHAIFPNEEAVNIAMLLSAAKEFRAGLSTSFRAKFEDAAISHSTENPVEEGEDSKQHVSTLYESLGFNAEVLDDDFARLEEAAEAFGGLGALSADAFLAVFEKMDADGHARGKDMQLGLKRFGEALTVGVAQETLQRERGVLLDLLALMTFMYGDLDQDELHEDFVGQIGEVYETVAMRLRNNEFLTWLAGNCMSVSGASGMEARTMTLLEAIFIAGWKCPGQPTHDGIAGLLTTWSKSWIHGMDLSANWDGLTGHVLAVLIQSRNHGLATEALKFVSRGEDTPSWLGYLEGRLALAQGDFAAAAITLQAAADGLADRRMKIESTDVTGLLDAEAKNALGNGRSRYFQHTSSLFEAAKIWSYTADFAQLALDNLDTNEIDLRRSLADIDRRKGQTDSPASSRIDDTMEEIRILKLTGDADDLRQRLFTALVQTGRWDDAFSALSGMKGSPTKRQDLRRLIESAIKADAAETLLALPFNEAGLLGEADALLAELAANSLDSGAGGIPYHRILYAFRAGRGDFRGAAQILYQYLQHLQVRYRKHLLQDPEDETLVRVYVLLINALVCCGEGEGWLLAEPTGSGLGGNGKRRLVRLEDVRREYVAELDRRSEVLMGRFPLIGGDDFGGSVSVDGVGGQGMEIDVF